MFRPLTRTKVWSEPKLDFSDVLIVPKRSSLNTRKTVDLNVRYTFKHSNNVYEGVPIVSSNRDTLSTSRMYHELSKNNIMSCFSKQFEYSDETYYFDNQTYMPSTGTSDDDFLLADTIIKKYKPRFMCIDVANGYIDDVLFAVDRFKQRYQHENITLCVGNVATPERVSLLIHDFGVDIVKIGISFGGVGYPQFSCVRDCANAARETGGYIMSDDGIECPADISKAFGAGADFVMIGSVLSGHYECKGEIFQKDGKLFMNSCQGEDSLVSYKGIVADTIVDILDDLRTTCTFTGNLNLFNFIGTAEFIKVNRHV